MKNYSSISSPMGNSSDRKLQICSKDLRRMQLKFVCIITVLSLFAFHQSKAQFTPTYGGSASTTDTIATHSGVTHISCDGLVDSLYSPTERFKVFAWDGGNAGWGYEYNGTKVTRSYFLSSTIVEPEIALVSDTGFNHIYALIIYIDKVDSAVYEFYKWNGTIFPTTPTYTGRLALSASNGETSIAGDRYGHFAMICDQGYNVSTDLVQQTGYVNASTGNISFGTIGVVNFGTDDISQPDIDITFDGDAHASLVYQAVVAVSFTDGPSQRVLSNSIDMLTLYGGTTWNTATGNLVNHSSIFTSGGVDHSSISLCDGYLSWVGSTASTPQGIYPIHYGVAYRDTNSTYSLINQYPVTLPNGWALYPFSIGIIDTAFSSLNITNIILENNNYPDVVLQPQESQMIVAWNFVNVSFFTSNILEGLANDFNYPFQYNVSSTWTDSCALGATSEMLFNVNSDETTEIAISTFTGDSLLYFYFDNNTFDLLYKTRLFANTALRKGIPLSIEHGNLYPNPSTDFVKLTNFDEKDSYALRLYSSSGAIQFTSCGKIAEINIQLNELLSTLNQGLYILKMQDSDGIISAHKLIKQ